MNIDKVRAHISQFSYTFFMNMKLLEVLMPLFIYHGCSTLKTLRERKFTPLNMKHFVVVAI